MLWSVHGSRNGSRDGVTEYWRSVGVLEYWSVGVLEYWSVGVLECWSVGVLEYWSVGVLECWSVGVLECWSVGVLECWSVGVLERVRKCAAFIVSSQPKSKPVGVNADTPLRRPADTFRITLPD
jgi:hypothetical protein